jgi:hypothetical protein
MKNINDFLNNRKTASPLNKRLSYFIDEYRKYKANKKLPIKILDIGCGHNCELSKFRNSEDEYYACDYFDNINAGSVNYRSVNLNEDNLIEIYKKQKFDFIFCGEVIEHLFSPDSLLDEIKVMMHRDSVLILSTPNLAYYMNRVLLLFGISPLFLENSSESKLGRGYRFLGQFNKTEGHIKVFTYGALRDLLKIKGFEVVKVRPVSVWGSFLDNIFLFPSFSANNVFVLRLK